MSHSPHSRIIFSFAANLIKSLMSFLTGMVVARGLGPDEYGAMIFLLATFTALRGLVDMGSSSAFFTFVSQRQRSRSFLLYYFIWLAVQFLVTLLVVGVLFPDSWMELFWLGHSRDLVLLAFLVAYMQTMLWTTVQQLGEALRLTHWVQGISALVAIVHFTLILLMLQNRWLSIEGIFILIILEWLVAILILASKLRLQKSNESADSFKVVLGQYWKYCLPLIPYTWISFAYDYVGRWLLQSYGGSVQQAFYAISFQLSAVVALATTSILHIIWKEIAESFYQHNGTKAAEIYRKTTTSLMVLASMLAGFLIPWSDELLQLTVGGSYQMASLTFTIMLLYPIHQCVGQINAVMAHATQQLATYTFINILSMSISLVVGYFVLADSTAYISGFGLGSVGFAAKMVAVQFITVNIFRLYLCKIYKIGFDFVFQIRIIVTYISIGFFSFYVVSNTLRTDIGATYLLMFAAFVYFLISVLIGVVKPGLLGMNSDDIQTFTNKAIRILKVSAR